MTDERENILDLRSEIIFEIILFLSKICFDLIYIFWENFNVIDF